MGENLDVPGREAVRTPMQWADDKNGGFSTAKPSQLARAVAEGSYAPERINAAEARRDQDSLLHHVIRLAKRYRESPEIGWGAFEVVEQEHEQVMAHRVTWEDRSMVLLHNLRSEPVTVSFELQDEEVGAELVDLLDEASCVLDSDHTAEVQMGGYGYRWLRIRRSGDPRLV